jgi:hypothetical protein
MLSSKSSSCKILQRKQVGHTNSIKGIQIRGGQKLNGLLSDTIQGFKDKASFDKKFVTKLSVELCVGFVTQLIAEFTKRGAQTMVEIDFVIANLIMGLFANFFSVYLTAPSLKSSLEPVLNKKETEFTKFSDGCPDNAFQKVTTMGPTFSILQRIYSVFKVAPKLFVIGFVAMALGTGFTTILSLVRTFVQQGGKLSVFSGLISQSTLNGFIELFKTSFAIGIYLAVSSNLRYQFIAGILETRIIEPVFSKLPILQTIGSFAARTANTYIGAAMMVDYLKLVAKF